MREEMIKRCIGPTFLIGFCAIMLMVVTWALYPTNRAALEVSAEIDIDENGNLYVMNRFYQTIQVFNRNGELDYNVKIKGLMQFRVIDGNILEAYSRAGYSYYDGGKLISINERRTNEGFARRVYVEDAEGNAYKFVNSPICPRITRKAATGDTTVLIKNGLLQFIIDPVKIIFLSIILVFSVCLCNFSKIISGKGGRT